MGGLGNQLFQYAAARAVAFRIGYPLKYDLTYMIKDPRRSCKLNHFEVHAEEATPREVSIYFPDRGENSGLYRSLRKLKNRFSPWFRLDILKEPSLAFHEEVLKVDTPRYLAGYWQSEKYFSDMGEMIRNELQVTTPPSEQNLNDLDEIRSNRESVSIHIRRGDYFSDEKNRSLYSQLKPGYYNQAMNLMKKSMSEPRFFFFSDDMEWVKNHFPKDESYRFMDGNCADEDYEDLRLMSACRHHIIANSTFGWWGAWLSGHRDKRVIAPKRWFNDEREHDIIPETWITI
jgi:hypothetical protein